MRRVKDLAEDTQRASAAGFVVAPESTSADPDARRAVIRSYTSKIDDTRETRIGEFLGLNLALCQGAYPAETDGLGKSRIDGCLRPQSRPSEPQPVRPLAAVLSTPPAIQTPD